MTTPILNNDRNIIINMPKSKQQPTRKTGCYQENHKELQVEKVQEVLRRQRIMMNYGK